MSLFVAAYNDIYAAEAIFQSAIDSGLEDVVFLFDVKLGDAIDALQAQGIEIESQTQTISDIAKNNGLDVYDVVYPLFNMNRQ